MVAPLPARSLTVLVVEDDDGLRLVTVSYTHLTLPTN